MSEEKKEFKLFEGGKLKQFSCSMGSSYKRCPAAAGFSYILGIKVKPSRFLHVGRGGDKGAEEGFKATGGGKKIAAKKVADISVAEYEACVKKDGMDTEGVDLNVAMGEDKDRLARMMKAFWEEQGKQVRVSTDIEPQSVIDVTMPDGLVVKNILDVVEDTGSSIRVFDFKTAQKKWAEGKEREELQPIYYTHAARIVSKKPVVGFGYLIAASNKVTPSIERREFTVPEEQLTRVPRLTIAFVKAYESLFAAGGLGVPNRSKFVCGWCGYRKLCEETYGGTPPGGEE